LPESITGTLSSIGKTKTGLGESATAEAVRNAFVELAETARKEAA
jgi:hypothetical protein